MARLSEELQAYFEAQECPVQVRVGELLALAGERSFGFGFVVLALPSALPLPAPGYSIPFGLAILVLSLQLVAGRSSLWLPAFVGNRQLRSEQMRRWIQTGMPWLQRIEKLSRPRWASLGATPLSALISGLWISLMASWMLIPLPGTNTLPAMAIFVTGFGLSEKDGLIIGLGWILSALANGVALLVLAAYFYGGVTLTEWIRSR